MQPNKVYDEVIEFIASSDFREKTEGLSSDEKSEVDHYLQIEHLMRLANARAHHYLANG